MKGDWVGTQGTLIGQDEPRGRRKKKCRMEEVQIQVPLTVGNQMPGEAGTAEEGKQVNEL